MKGKTVSGSSAVQSDTEFVQNGSVLPSGGNTYTATVVSQPFQISTPGDYYLVQTLSTTLYAGPGSTLSFALPDDSSVDPVPEPATLIIWSLLGGLAVTIGWRCRRRAA